jgi:phosphoribosylaminoimidazole (AIR) synthetase
MAVIVAQEDAANAMRALEREGESVFSIGEIRDRSPGEAQTLIV